MADLRWGIKTAPQHTTYDAMVKVWQDADRTAAFEHAWLFDHFSPIQGDLDGPCFEGWTLLSALAPTGQPGPSAAISEGRLQVTAQSGGQNVAVDVRAPSFRIEITAEGLRIVNG